MAQSFFLFHLLTLHPSGARGNAWEQMSLWALGQKLSAEIGKLTVKAHEKSVHTRARYTSDPGAPNSIAAAQDPLESPLNRNPFPWGQPGAATASQGMHFWEVPDMWLCQKVWLWQGEVCGAAGALRVFWDSRSSSWVVLSRRWLIWRNEVWATAGNPTFGVLATFTYPFKQVGWLAEGAKTEHQSPEDPWRNYYKWFIWDVFLLREGWKWRRAGFVSFRSPAGVWQPHIKLLFVLH